MGYARGLHGVTSCLRGGTEDISDSGAVVRSRNEHTTAFNHDAVMCAGAGRERAPRAAEYNVEALVALA